MNTQNSLFLKGATDCPPNQTNNQKGDNMNQTIKKMESVRSEYLKLAKMARESDESIQREFFIEIADLITHFINIAEIEQGEQ